MFARVLKFTPNFMINSARSERDELFYIVFLVCLLLLFFCLFFFLFVFFFLGGGGVRLRNSYGDTETRPRI